MCVCVCSGMATLESERIAFEAEKKAHYNLYERQQQVLCVCVCVIRDNHGNHRTLEGCCIVVL